MQCSLQGRALPRVQPPDLHVLGRDGDAAGVEGAQVGVWRAHSTKSRHTSEPMQRGDEPHDPLKCGLTFEHSDQVRLGRLLQREDRG